MLITIGELSRATGMESSTLHTYLDSGRFNQHRYYDNSREFIITDSFIDDLISHLKFLKTKRRYKSYETNIQRLIKFKIDLARASALFFYGRKNDR